MTACSWAHLGSKSDRSRQSPVRAVWAGVISLLLHLTIATTLTGRGQSGPIMPYITPPPLSARLIEAAAPPAIELPSVSGHATEPVKNEHRAGARRRDSVAPSQADQAMRAERSTRAGHDRTDGPDLTYYGARQLDIYPTLSSPLQLRYTGQAAAAASGRALVLLLIDNTGVVDDVALVEPEPGGDFEEELRRVFGSARFTPAFKGGRAVRSRLLVRVNYGLEDASAQPTLK